jgi:hypothetical protein
MSIIMFRRNKLVIKLLEQVFTIYLVTKFKNRHSYYQQHQYYYIFNGKFL